jgi:hypothetical protein
LLTFETCISTFKPEVEVKNLSINNIFRQSNLPENDDGRRQVAKGEVVPLQFLEAHQQLPNLLSQPCAASITQCLALAFGRVLFVAASSRLPLMYGT